MENLSKRALRIGIIAGSMCICTAAYAAIPVIDDQNILQQLKTYEETVKVVTNTKEQISLQLKELEKRVNGGEYAVAFAMFPTSMEELMKVADARLIMPPKSTWFEPKLRSGLVTYRY